ncbi:MAG: c-type cytochrome [Planctomycetes bacterium]|nr:c-type cytochrome [Planctomycetota bacterium]
MSAGGSRYRLGALAVAGPALLGLSLLVAGCGGCGSNTEYPPTLTFPPRADRLVLKLPDKPAPGPNRSGKRDDDVAELDAHGGRTADPPAVAGLDVFLKDTFGTPAAPNDLHAPFKLTKAHLAEGSKLYKRHCADCHNVTGDGRGQKSGQFVVPFPRDYRQGAFKFVTSGAGLKPRRADLLRTLNDGLKGTAMPSFALLQEGERDLMVGYVTYLAARGQVEFEALRAQTESQPNDFAARLKAVLAEWDRAEAAPPLPAAPDDGEPDTPAHQEAIRRGHRLFTAKADDACANCHGEYGRKPVFRYEVWGTTAKPANFVEPQFKGGARPEDLFARVRFGIPSAGMPAHGAPKYTDRDVWDLVRFVSAGSAPAKLPPDVRAAVYPNP